jgi:hypothetical protein
LTRQAWEAVRAVAEALNQPGEGEIPTAGPGQPDEAVRAQLYGAGLSSGNAGLALFYTYLAQITQDDAWADAAAERIDRALEAVAHHPIGPSLYGGFAGVGWVLEHLQGRLFEPEEGEETGGETTQALLQLLDGDAWGSDYDLIGGLVGFGVYALEALPAPEARALLGRILDHLEALAEERPDGLTWFTDPRLLPPHQRQLYPEGYYNVGVAHGVPGIVGLLAGMAAAGVEPERTGRLLEGGVSWVLAQEGESEIGRCFPHFSAPGLSGGGVGGGAGPGQASRLAWCYGDPGIAAVLLLAARAAGRADWEERAVATALRAAARPFAVSQVRDVGLCHGTAGLGHVFNRLHQATGRPELATAARDWFRRTLEMRQPEGVGGFLCWDTAKGGWWPERGFLTGAAGVGLCLLGAVSAVEPAWDRALLSAVPAKP